MIYMYNFLLCPINEISRKWLNLYMCLWFLCQMFFVLDTAKFLTCSEKWFKWICKKYWGSTSVRRSLSLSILSFYNKPDFPKKKLLFCSVLGSILVVEFLLKYSLVLLDTILQEFLGALSYEYIGLPLKFHLKVSDPY